MLVAPAAFGARLRAPQVAAAGGRGLERAGLMPPDLCPLADGGPGTLEVLLTALGGETAGVRVRGVAAGFALLEDGGTAVVEPHESPQVTAALLAAAARSGAAVVLVAASTGAAAAQKGPVGEGVRVVALCDPRAPSPLAQSLAAAGALLESAAAFVLDALEFDSRMRAARCLVTGEEALEPAALHERITGDVATRARQAGVPAHAVTARNGLDAFAARIVDLQCIIQAATLDELEAAGERLGDALREGRI